MSPKNATIPWADIQSHAQQSTEKMLTFSRIEPVSGGNMHAAFCIKVDCDKALFVKINDKKTYPVFISEAESLCAIKNTQSIVTPKVICHGKAGLHSYLVMEHLCLSSSGNEYALGQQLAKVHQTSTYKLEGAFGFDNDNHIGLTPQKNLWTASWHDFWVEQRLKPQLQLAYQNGFRETLKPYEVKLILASNELLSHHSPVAALVHGDLWSGNKAYQNQAPVIFDPACYYADREVDIAMTELFGGFSAEFYQGYNDVWPIERAYEQRKTLYNLYHMLNHLNLFGSGYLRSVKHMIADIINFD